MAGAGRGRQNKWKSSGNAPASSPGLPRPLAGARAPSSPKQVQRIPPFNIQMVLPVWKRDRFLWQQNNKPMRAQVDKSDNRPIKKQSKIQREFIFILLDDRRSELVCTRIFVERNCSEKTQQGWRQGRATGGYSPPSEEILGSCRRKFGKITHGNTIFQSF